MCRLLDSKNLLTPFRQFLQSSCFLSFGDFSSLEFLQSLVELIDIEHTSRWFDVHCIKTQISFHIVISFYYIN
jgi:hypothetical protein